MPVPSTVDLDVCPALAVLDVANPAYAYAEAGCEATLNDPAAQAPYLSHLFLCQLGATMRLPFQQKAALQVYRVGHQLNVAGINTPMVTAEMIAFQAFWNWPDQTLIGQSVREDYPAATVCATADTESPITSLVMGCRPFPARFQVGPMGRDGAEAHLCPEASRQAGIAKGRGSAKLGLHRKVTPFAAMQPGALRGVAAASIIQEGDRTMNSEGARGG